MNLGNRGVLSQDEAYTMRSLAEYVAAELACEVFPRNRLLAGWFNLSIAGSWCIAKQVHALNTLNSMPLVLSFLLYKRGEQTGAARFPRLKTVVPGALTDLTRVQPRRSLHQCF